MLPDTPRNGNGRMVEILILDITILDITILDINILPTFLC